MSTTRTATALARSLTRQSTTTPTRRGFAQPISRPQPLAHRALQPTLTPLRWHSTPPQKSTQYDYEAMKTLTATPSPDRLVIDVREPSEFAAGALPTAVNIPVKSAPDALLLPADEFEDRFGFAKPSAEQEVVFYCKSGVRSNAAAEIARQVGYGKVGEYRGSWLDWEKNGGGK